MVIFSFCRQGVVMLRFHGAVFLFGNMKGLKGGIALCPRERGGGSRCEGYASQDTG